MSRLALYPSFFFFCVALPECLLLIYFALYPFFLSFSRFILDTLRAGLSYLYLFGRCHTHPAQLEGNLAQFGFELHVIRRRWKPKQLVWDVRRAEKVFLKRFQTPRRNTAKGNGKQTVWERVHSPERVADVDVQKMIRFDMNIFRVKMFRLRTRCLISRLSRTHGVSSALQLGSLPQRSWKVYIVKQ